MVRYSQRAEEADQLVNAGRVAPRKGQPLLDGGLPSKRLPPDDRFLLNFAVEVCDLTGGTGYDTTSGNGDNELPQQEGESSVATGTGTITTE